MQFCCTVALHTGIEPSDILVGGNTQERRDPVFSPSDYQLEFSAHSLLIEQRSSLASSYMRAQHSSAGTTTPVRAGGATSFRLLSSHSNMNTPPIIKSRSLGRSQDDGDEGAIVGIRYPSSWGQNRSLPRHNRESSAAGFDESFHSAECHYAALLNQPTMVSSKGHHSVVIFDHIILSYSN